jgi:hypothetical protein
MKEENTWNKREEKNKNAKRIIIITSQLYRLGRGKS